MSSGSPSRALVPHGGPGGPWPTSFGVTPGPAQRDPRDTEEDAEFDVRAVEAACVVRGRIVYPDPLTFQRFIFSKHPDLTSYQRAAVRCFRPPTTCPRSWPDTLSALAYIWSDRAAKDLRSLYPPFTDPALAEKKSRSLLKATSTPKRKSRKKRRKSKKKKSPSDSRSSRIFQAPATRLRENLSSHSIARRHSHRRDLPKQDDNRLETERVDLITRPVTPPSTPHYRAYPRPPRLHRRLLEGTVPQIRHAPVGPSRRIPYLAHLTLNRKNAYSELPYCPTHPSNLRNCTVAPPLQSPPSVSHVEDVGSSPVRSYSSRAKQRSRVECSSNPFQIPHPHNFQTFDRRAAAYDPLNFVPGGEDPVGHLYLPGTSRARAPSQSSRERLDQTQEALKKLSLDPSDPLANSVPYCDISPLEHSRRDKRLKSKSTEWIRSSFRKLFRSKSDTSESSCQTLTKRTSKEKSGNFPFQITVTPPPKDKISPTERTGNEIIRRSAVMASARHLNPSSAVMALSKQKSEAMRLAREQGAAVREMCRRAKTEIPPYTFEELIGKGAYGRVYKGRQLPTQNLVAIKVLEIDTLDYKVARDFKDMSIKDFIHETKVMTQAKDAGAKNVNMIIEAISIHSQLWLICEYCPGGSVKTLMRATGDRLEERFIIPVARELAEGLRAIHDAGIIHRDVKAANVLIHEEGRLQICDFGVAGVLQSNVDKRSTWIGTPHWMPPEMFPNRMNENPRYGSELDVWAYGCTLFECATGNPPNATLRERMQIGRQLNRFPPKLEDDAYTEELRSLVGFALDSDPLTRPSMQQILQHPYIADTSETHPTSSLSELVKIYYQWVQRGGQRVSLFSPGGAIAAEMPGDNALSAEDWNFSTTDGFERRFSILDLDELSASLADLQAEIEGPSTSLPSHGSFEDTGDVNVEMTPAEQANFDERVKRGAAAMEGLFDEAKPDYKYETKNDFVPVEQKQQRCSDLPLRTDTDRSSVASTFIDINLGDYESAHYAAGTGTTAPFQLADADTIRANRSSNRLTRVGSGSSSDVQETEEYPVDRGPRPPTMEWTFPSSMQPETGTTDNEDEQLPADRDEKRDTRAWTFPVMTPEDTHEDHPSSQEDLSDDVGEPVSDDMEDSELTARTVFPAHQHPPHTSYGSQDYGAQTPPEPRPSTSASSYSTVSETDVDPFRFDRAVTPPGTAIDTRAQPPFEQFPPMTDSTGYNDYETPPSTLGGGRGTNGYQDHSWQDVPSSRNGSFSDSSSFDRPMQPSYPGSRRAGVHGASSLPHLNFPQPVPPSIESLTEGASDEVVTAELDRLLGDFLDGLAATGEALSMADVRRSIGNEERTVTRQDGDSGAP